jgi:hypothetical protein
MARKRAAPPVTIEKTPPDWARIKNLFHTLWGECHSKEYDKAKWTALHTELIRAEREAEENRRPAIPDPLAELFVVRLFDMFDGWIDITGAVTRAEADRILSEKTDGGKKNVSYGEGDYYRIFPANTRMLVTPEALGR